jgi:O-antigen/teichoic acid export membrane protein
MERLWETSTVLRRLALHVSNYAIGNLLVTISGFISFPIFTRIFSVAEYGILNLISATLGLLLAISKLGVQQSIVRFYGEVRAGRRENSVSQYLSTTLFGMAAVGLTTTVIWAAVSQLIPSTWWSDPRVTDLFLITAVLLFIRTVDSSLVNFLRAEERSGLLNVYNVAKRYGTLVLVLATLFYVAHDLYGYFWATVVAEGLAVGLLLVSMSRTRRFSPREYSPELFRRMLVFGIPMIAFELSGIVLNIGDRYVIEAMLGNEALGVYSAGYNFCQYVQVVFLAALSQAVAPMFVRSWEEKGAEETAQFVRKTLHYYLLAAFPLVAGISAVGREMLVVLASDKYTNGATIIPYVAGGMAVDGALSMLAAGLYIQKRTMIMAALMAFCAVLNVALNIGLIPSLGIVGAALATLLAYCALSFGAWRAGRQLLPYQFPWGSTIKFALLSLIMYAIVSEISFTNRWETISAQILIGVLVYAVLVLLFDQQARSALRVVVTRITKRA